MSQKIASVGELTHLVGYRLRRASNAFAADFSEAIQGTGMRQVLVGILGVVDANPGINQGAAGTMLGIKRANMVPLINELTERGLVERLVASEDRRALCLSLTDAGKMMLNDCLSRIHDHENRMLERLSAAERKTLLDLLARIGSELPAG